MPQYDFVSPGGEAVDALTKALLMQEQLKRQKMIDELNAKNVESQIKDRESNRRIQEEAAQALAEQRRTNAQKVAQEEFVKNAPAIGTIASPGLQQRAKAAGMPDTIEPGQTLPSTQISAGVPGMPPLVTPQAAKPDESVPAKFAGTPGQQTSARLGELLDGVDDPKKIRSIVTRSGLVPFHEVDKFVKDYVAAGTPPKAEKPEKISPTEMALRAAGAKDFNNPTPEEAKRAMEIEADMRKRGSHAPASASAGGVDPEIAAIGDSIIAGKTDPMMRGMYRFIKPMKAYLASKGFDLVRAQMDYQATMRHFSTLNDNAQVRLRQSMDTAFHSLDKVDSLADEWDGLNIGPLNKASLALAKSGIMGQKAQSAAVRLDGQITDLTFELANVYQGGGVPSDKAKELAETNLAAWWAKGTIHDMTEQSRFNLNIRKKAMDSTKPVTASSQAQDSNFTLPEGVTITRTK